LTISWLRRDGEGLGDGDKIYPIFHGILISFQSRNII